MFQKEKGKSNNLNQKGLGEGNSFRGNGKAQEDFDIPASYFDVTLRRELDDFGEFLTREHDVSDKIVSKQFLPILRRFVEDVK